MALRSKKTKTEFSDRKKNILEVTDEFRDFDRKNLDENLFFANFNHNTHPAEIHDDDSNWLVSYADMMTLLFGFFALLMSFSKIDIETYEKTREETTKFFGGEYKLPTSDISKEIKNEIMKDKLMDQVRMQINGEGITVTFRGALFFDIASIELKKEAQEIIQKIVPILKKQSSQYTVMIEGHTDDSPINSPQFPSNWELSSYRAASVLHYFEKAGFPKSNLRALGYADIEPVVPNRDKNGNPIADNQSQNRRVVIRLLRAKVQ